MAPFMSAHRLLPLVVSLVMTLVAVHATEVMHRPAGYKNPPHIFKMAQDVHPHIIHKRASGKVNMAYFTNWGIYGANFQPTDIVPSDLTHILYAFADVSADTGVISLTDSYADEQKHFDGDSWDEPGTNLYGCLKQLYLLKLKNRNLKVLLSIGGWTYSQENHFSFVTNAASRSAFVTSAVSMVENYGFDGIDIDFEYPSSAEQGQGFADLVTALRTAFDDLQTQKGDSTAYQITAAVAAGYPNYANYAIPQMDSALTYWNLMSYDYARSWSTVTDDQANVYGGVRTNFSTDKAVQYYAASGATASKINMGIPLYGRAFEETDGLGAPYTGVGPGTIEAGVYSYKTLPLAGAQVYENTTDISSYSYDSSKREFVSYDTPNIVKLKVQYANSKDFAGTMFWDLSTDKVGSDSLVGTAHTSWGSLDSTQNHISFPNSKWDNIKDNMGQGGSSTTSAPTSTTTTKTGTTTTTTSATSTTTSGSGACAGVAAWTAATVYTGGQTATYNSHLWTAQWWTQGDTPGGSAGVWVDNGAC